MQQSTNIKPKHETVSFPPNQPVTVSLKYPQPKRIDTQMGERFMYSLQDGRVMFLFPEQAEQITQLGVNVGEEFTITRYHSPNAPDSWGILRKEGEQPNGTLVLATGKPVTRSTASVPPIHRPSLVDEANALVDAFATVLDRALTTYHGRVKPDEIRSLLLSAYIQRQRNAA